MSAVMGPDLDRLGAYVRARRLELDLSISEASRRAGRGVGTTTWGKLERGIKVDARTLARVARVLRWTPDSPALVLDGGEPELLVETVEETAVGRALLADTTISEQSREMLLHAYELARLRGPVS